MAIQRAVRGGIQIGIIYFQFDIIFSISSPQCTFQYSIVIEEGAKCQSAGSHKLSGLPLISIREVFPFTLVFLKFLFVGIYQGCSPYGECSGMLCRKI